jgi:DNA-binding beta-propeller fold protein YncE
MKYAALILLCLLLASCGPEDEEPAATLAPAEPLVWPEPPAKARIEFLYAFRNAEDLGFRPSFFDQVWEVIAGENEQGLIRPYAIAVDEPLIAVADPGARALHIFDKTGNSYEKIREVGDDLLLSPVGVSFGPGRIYLSDSALNKVFALNAEGELLFTIEDMERPTGIVFERGADRLYLVDTLRHRVVVFDSEGRELFAFGERGTENGEFNYPTHLFIHAGRLYVNDTMNFRLQVFDLDGNHLSTFGKHGDSSGDFAQPKGVGVDEDGHVYVVDALFSRVQIFDFQGNFLLAFGAPGATPGRLWLPSGLSIVEGQIYVADSYNRRVQVYQFLGGD